MTYTPEQRLEAIALRKLRLISVLFGLGTVVLTYVAGGLICGQREIVTSAAAFVAFLPKFNVVSSVFTNDSLVIMLSSLGLVLALAYRRIPHEKTKAPAKMALALCLGLTAGAALITKLNSLPVFAVLLGSLLIVRRNVLWAALRDVVIAATGFLLTAGWWLLMNYRLSGDPLGQKGVYDWLNEVLPGIVSIVPWTDSERFLNVVPGGLFQSIWYDGAWNQFLAPFAFNLVLTCIASVALFGVLKAFGQGGRYISKAGFSNSFAPGVQPRRLGGCFHHSENDTSSGGASHLCRLDRIRSLICAGRRGSHWRYGGTVETGRGALAYRSLSS